MWCKGFWDVRVPKVLMGLAWSAAVRAVDNVKHAWQAVKGPAGAVLATMKRIGWSPVRGKYVASFVEWKTPFGVIDIRKVCPTAVGDLVDRSTEAALWRAEASRNSKLDHLANGANIQPILKLLQGPDSAEWGAVEKGQLRSLCALGQWPQERLYRAGLVDNDRCVVCGEKGTLFHRLWECRQCESYREQYASGNTLERWSNLAKQPQNRNMRV